MSALLALTADFGREMRVGTLEITVALIAVAVLAARPRVRTVAEIGPITPMQVELHVLDRSSDRTYAMRPPFVIGRDRSADVVVRDAEVSRRHLRFESREGVVYVEDLKTTNGSFLNGRRLTEAIEVRQGDELDVGTTRVVVAGVRPG
ncbi:MAG: FHA domain-containing protein [Candidatus Eremiobacteraeota bacterium]|nr:FHA domain-containing protein [Candidatus Eremiobacteraeota bacterium]MBV9056413.1 FHA domain-containing protein [Candidatus Eremiobacteraeota bacterium]MBV9700800.1 FHA domain-containing protein [Candidatus Eremiobacteraeota bacterium]